MPLKRFRFIAILEGISFLTLLSIAMPLKYLAHLPMPVKINGWIHGLLFIFYIIFLLQVQAKLRWPVKTTLIAFIAAFLPFGTFVLDAKVLKKSL